MRRRRFVRRGTGWGRALSFAFALHAAIAAALFVSWSFSRPAQPPAMQAKLVREPPPDVKEKARQEQERQRAEREVAERKKQREEELERRRIAEEQKRKEAERVRLEAQRKKQEEEQRKAEQARREKEEAQRKKAEAERLKREEERRLAEAALQEQLAKEEELLNESKRIRLASLQEKYIVAIKQKVNRMWIRPTTVKGLKCTVFVRQTTAGEVLEAKILRSSGNGAFDRSVEAAVYKASPLPAPPSPEVFDRDLEFIFDPDEA